METVEQFLARGGAIVVVPPTTKVKKPRGAKVAKVVLARTTIIHHSDGSKFVKKENFLTGDFECERVSPEKLTSMEKSKMQRKAEQKGIAKNKGNFSKPKYFK
jgi:hypothetical protein